MMHTPSLRKITDLEPGEHTCFLYETDDEHRAVLTSYIRRGLERGEKVLYVLDANSADTILEYLRADGLDVVSCLSSGRLRLMGSYEAYMADGFFDPAGTITSLRKEAERALAEGYKALRTTAEMTWILRNVSGSERFVEYAARLNEFFHEGSSLALCQFDRRRFPPSVLLHMLSTHSYVVIGKDVFDNFYYSPPEVILDRSPKAAILDHRLHNLSERKRVEEALCENEEKYRLLFNAESDAILLFDPYTRGFGDANDAALHLYGYSREEIRSLKLDDICVEIEESSRMMQEALGLGQVRVRLWWSKKKDGTVFPVEVSAGVFKWKQQDVICMICRDITERMQAEEALQRSQEQLIQAQKMKALGTLVAGMAHEINNPVNLILFNAPLLRRIWSDLLPILSERAKDEPDRKYGGLTYEFLQANLDQLLSDVQMAANRVTKIVGDLKDFSRQSKVGSKEPVNINAAVENAMRLAEVTLRKSGVTLQRDLGEDLPLIEGNLQNLEQMALNLTLNAVEAIEHDHGVIELTTRFDASTGQVILSVSDNGRGIDPSIANELFDPFVTSRQAKGGTGLGLSITHNLVKAHNGEINFWSRPGEGTTFSVSFPAELKGKMRKVLVADDDPALRKMLRLALMQRGNLSVKEAPNGMEAAVKLGTYRPDLLVLDIRMPEMDGLEVCRVIKNEPALSGLKVIVTTGFPDDPKVEKIREMGFANVLFKPIELNTLFKAVSDLLDVP